MSKNYGVKIKYMAKVRVMLMMKILGEIEQLHDEQTSLKCSNESFKT